MKYKKSLIILILTIFLFGMSFACASDMNDTPISVEHNMPLESAQDNNLKTDENNEILTGNPETFTQLDNDINESQDTFELQNNYTFNNETDSNYTGGIVIDKSNFVVEGNGYTINAQNQAQIFHITGSNVTLQNINFINGNGETNGGAIYFNEIGTVINSTFTDNIAMGTSETSGGAIYFNGTGTMINCEFYENYADYGGAIFAGKNTKIEDCEFYANNAKYGGAIYIVQNGTITNSSFTLKYSRLRWINL